MNDSIKFNKINRSMFIMRCDWNKYCNFHFEKIGFAGRSEQND